MAEDVKDDAQDAAGDKADKAKVQFDENQQTIFNAAINEAFTRAFEKADGIYKSQIEALKKEITDLKTAKPADDKSSKEAADADKDKGKKKDKEAVEDPRLATVLAQLEEVTNIAKTLQKQKEDAEAEANRQAERNKEARIKEEFIRAAEKIGFFDTMDVFSLVRHELDVEDDSVIIKNPRTGLPRKAGSVDTNMTLDQFLSDFAKSKPFLVRSKNAAGGTDAGASKKLSTTDKTEEVDYSKMSRADFIALTNQTIGRQYTERR